MIAKIYAALLRSQHNKSINFGSHRDISLADLNYIISGVYIESKSLSKKYHSIAFAGERDTCRSVFAKAELIVLPNAHKHIKYVYIMYVCMCFT